MSKPILCRIIVFALFYLSAFSASSQVKNLDESVRDYSGADPTPVFALKTNLLTSLLLTPSLEVEAFFNSHLSLNLSGHYAQWVMRDKKWEIYGWDFSPELRYYTTPAGERFGGHHYWGVYYQRGDFDLRLSEDGRMGDYQGGGLSYGYAVPMFKYISRPHTWWAEFGISLGYSRIEYDRYQLYKYECKAFDKHRIRHHWGPTRLRLSIIYRFNTTKKGGKQ